MPKRKWRRRAAEILGGQWRKPRARVDRVDGTDQTWTMESQDNIQLLLAAEKEGQEIVNKARSEKTQRLRQAKEEAEREIAHYRAQREEKYKKMLEEQSGNSGTTNEALNAKVDDELKSMNAVVDGRMPKVVDFLYERITTIE